jgi:hypothetical protein
MNLDPVWSAQHAGIRLRSYRTSLFVTDSYPASTAPPFETKHFASSTASWNAVLIPKPRLGYMQCAASPSKVTRPFDHL